MRQATLLFVIVASVALVIACAPPRTDDTGADRPKPPQQQPSSEITQYGLHQQQVTQALEDLGTQQVAIEDYMKAWRSTKAQTVGPQFQTEPQRQKEKILRLCDKLEEDLGDLSQEYELTRFSGASANVKRIREFVKETRRELQR